MALARIWRPGPQPGRAHRRWPRLSRRRRGPRVYEVILMVPSLVGRSQSLGGVTAKVKRLEQDRDAGGRHIDRGGPPWPPTWPSGHCAREAGCPAAYPVRPPAQEVVSLYAFAVKSRYPHTRTSSYEFVGVHNCRLSCTHFRPTDSRRTQEPWSGAPLAGFEPATRRLEDVGTESAPVHPCRPRRLVQDFHRAGDL